MKFCSNCGAAVALKVPPGDTLPRYVCDACNTIHYQNPRMVVGCIVEWEGQVLLCKRAISATLQGGDALGSASLAKSVWAELGQDLAVLAFDALGHTNNRWMDRRLSSRSLTIAGGKTQVNKGITATRSRGLPRP